MIPWGLIWATVGRVVAALPLWMIGCILCAAVGSYAGYTWATDNAEDARIESVQRAIEQANQIAKQDQEVLDRDAEKQIEIQTRYRTIYRNISGVTVTDCRDLGPEFVRLFNDAIRAID